MNPPPGTFKLFRVAGITVYLHWAWAVVAYLQINNRHASYTSVGWAVAEYVSLFLIVLLHEFGHALACLSVGGKADTIMLWPLGGIAFVQAPPRPGPQLWSLAAGPLVNVLLTAPTVFGYLLARQQPNADLHEFAAAIAVINIGLLIFNMLPVYPLDGGQILRCIIWFFAGPVTSLLITGWIGVVGAAAFLILAMLARDFILGFIALYVAFQAWQGIQRARALAQMARAGLPTPM